MHATLCTAPLPPGWQYAAHRGILRLLRTRCFAQLRKKPSIAIARFKRSCHQNTTTFAPPAASPLAAAAEVRTVRSAPRSRAPRKVAHAENAANATHGGSRQPRVFVLMGR
jgi:hypothetical protein